MKFRFRFIEMASLTKFKIPVVLRVRPLNEKEQKDSYQVTNLLIPKTLNFRLIININI